MTAPACLLFSLLASAAALAQPPSTAGTPLEKATEPAADKPATIDPKPKLSDAEIERLVAALAGSYQAPASGENPELRLNAAPITVEGLDNAVYFEIARADAPATPFRQGVFHAFRNRGELWLRVFDFAGGAGAKDSMTGLWAAPEAMPRVSLESLSPNLDLVLAGAGEAGTWRGTVPHAYPTTRGGAVEMTGMIQIGRGEIRMSDAGFSAEGVQVWGARGPDGTVFKKVAGPDAAAKVVRNENGLVIITLAPAPADAAKLTENGQVAVQYTGWLTDGTRFDSSRLPGRDPFVLRVPGPVIKGWNEGLKDIAKGERRKLVIPPTLAYGEQGTRDRRIPPNSTLIFDVECVYVDNTVPSPPQLTPPVQRTPHGMGAGAGGAPPAGKPASDDKPK